MIKVYVNNPIKRMQKRCQLPIKNENIQMVPMNKICGAPPLGHGGMELRSTPPKAPKNNQFKHKLFTSLHTPKIKEKKKKC